jgi:quinol monooxygenase YgiN
MNKSIELKKILRDYNYLYESLIDIKEISSVAEIHFREALMKTNADALKALVPEEQDSKKLEEVKDIEEDIIEHNDSEFKKLFRKVVVKCHPDKLSTVTSENEIAFLKESYSQAIKANDKYDWGLLLRVASTLNVEYDSISDEQINAIRSKNEELKNEISKYEGSMAYQWYTKNEEDARNKFLELCAGVLKQSMQK